MVQKFFRITLTLFGLLAFCFAGQSVLAAQPSPEQMLAGLDGLQTAYARKYVSSEEFLGYPTPEVSDQTTPIVADNMTPSTMLVTVLEFESPEQVTQNFDSVLNGMTAKLILGESDIDLETTEIDDLGDQAYLYTGVRDINDEQEQMMLLVVQNGNLGFLISARGMDPAIETTVQNVAASMVDAEPGDDSVTVDGLSFTGSTFDIMPTGADAEVLHGLIPMYSYDLLLNGGTEPLEHIHSATPEA